jgi:tRNA threonylcarbamoyladenosine modification (KEOPS) complex  Pcc1 subunit
LDQTFHGERTLYTASVDASQDETVLIPAAVDSDATIRVNGAEMISESGSVTIALAEGQNQISLEVIAEDGATSMTYTIVVYRGSDGVTEGSLTSLSELSLVGVELDQAFQGERTFYTASVDATQETITLRAVAGDDGATIRVNGNEVASDSGSVAITLTEGQNLIEVLVSSADGSASTAYTLAIFRGSDAAAERSQAQLSRLSLLGIRLDETFQPDRLNYTADTSYSRSTTTLTPVATDEGATIRVNGEVVASGSMSSSIALAVGQNLIEIEVTSADGNAMTTYTVAVYRSAGTSASSNASLSGLTLIGATLDQLFQSNQLAYSASVNFLQPSVTLVPVAAHASATIRVNGIEVASGSASSAIALTEGQNLISLEVTAEDGITTETYSIILLREYAAWFAQQAYLKASNAEPDDWLGYSLAISGDTLVVAGLGEDSSAGGGEADNAASEAGAAYVFTRSGGVWSQQAYLKASNAEAGDEFGASVALSDDTLVVGAYREDSSANGGEGDNSAMEAGAAYVFTRSGGVWSQQAYLKASNAEAGDGFGVSVALSEDTLVVGARYEAGSAGGGEGDNTAPNAGAAYVFTRSGGVWSQQAYLKASNAEGSDGFGWSVALSGDTLVVGAYGEDSSAGGGEGDNTASTAGAAYVFTRSGSVWSQQAYLKASNAEAGDWFGRSVALSDETLVVGAYREDSSTGGGEGDNSATEAGAAYVFTRSGGLWSQQAYLKASNAEAADWFGYGVALTGDTLVVGAYGEDSSVFGGEGDNSAPGAGAAYVFTRSGAVWSQQAYLKASNAEASDLFGYSVAVSGDTLVVGARYEDSSTSGGESDNSAADAGAAYVWQ